MLHPRTFTALVLLNDLRHAALEALARKHKLPSLLLFYSFIDICASVALGHLKMTNRERFERFLKEFSCASWKALSPYDLWSARSSVLHAFSPLGDHTKKANGAVPIFYYSWPETEDQMRSVAVAQGHSRFHVVDVSHIKHIAIDCFNALWSKVENDDEFEATFRSNSENLLKNLHYLHFENEMSLLAELSRLSEGESSR